MNFIKQFAAITSVLIVNINIAPAQISEDFKTFEKDNYSISYPASWEFKSEEQQLVKFYILSPKTTEEDPFRENVNLVIQDLKGEKMNVAQFAELSEKQINTFFKNAKILESKGGTHENMEYHKIVYNATQGIFKLTFMQFYFIKDEKAYVLTFTSEQGQYLLYKSIGERILHSFKFI